MTHRILVPIDETRYSLTALEPGAVLARQLHIPLEAISVQKSGNALEARREELRSVVRQLGYGQAEVTVVSDPDPTARLLQEAQGDAPGLICMATHARGPVTEMLLGSVASTVIRHSNQPVILVGPRLSLDWDPPIRTVLACIDESPDGAAVLEHASALAAPLRADIQLIRTVSVPPESIKEGANWFTGSDWHTATGQQAAQFASPAPSPHWDNLKHHATELEQRTGQKASCEVLFSDNPATAAVDYADAQPGPLLVTGTHAGSALKRLILGSFASALVQNARCPVMIVPE
ncbi:MAG: universal stress protein [Ectothiorhodospiraceae bacterium]|nr:universal stress protein [Ectothiorhodospiraceae bacterium]